MLNHPRASARCTRGCPAGRDGEGIRRPRAERAPPHRKLFLPVTVEKGLDSSVSVCAVKLPDPQRSAIGHDGEGAAAWGACRPFENLINMVVAIIDVSMRGSANRIDASDEIDAEPARSILGWCRFIFRFKKFSCRAESICMRLSGCPRVSCDLHHSNTNE